MATYDHDPVTTPVDLRQEKKMVQIIYLLQGLAYFTGITAVIGLVMNYIKRDDCTGSWLASHHRWQIRTFWFGLLWCVLGSLLTLVLIGWAILFATGVWLIYRIAKGWIRLSENKPMLFGDTPS